MIININCTFVDNRPIHIGNQVLIASNVQIYTSGHPVLPDERLVADWKEKGTTFFRTFAKPVTIEDGVWIGGGTIILPGVTIGKNSVIGAGSVVTRSIPENYCIVCRSRSISVSAIRTGLMNLIIKGRIKKTLIFPAFAGGISVLLFPVMRGCSGFIILQSQQQDFWIEWHKPVCCCNLILRVVFYFPISLWRTARFFFEALSEMAHLMKSNSSGNISNGFIRFFQKLCGF